MQSEDGVSQEFDHRAAGAAGDERTEQRILDGANDHLDARRDHSLDQDRRHVGTETAREVLHRRDERSASSGMSRRTAPPFGLVQKRRSQCLERDRIADRGGRARRHPSTVPATRDAAASMPAALRSSAASSGVVHPPPRASDAIDGLTDRVGGRTLPRHLAAPPALRATRHGARANAGQRLGRRVLGKRVRRKGRQVRAPQLVRYARGACMNTVSTGLTLSANSPGAAHDGPRATSSGRVTSGGMKMTTRASMCGGPAR